MVGSCGKTENRNRYRDILKNRNRNRYRLLKKPTKKPKTDTDPALLSYRATHTCRPYTRVNMKLRVDDVKLCAHTQINNLSNVLKTKTFQFNTHNKNQNARRPKTVKSRYLRYSPWTAKPRRIKNIFKN